MALTPQLPPTDYEAIGSVTDRAERELLYEANAINKHAEPQGMRYTKGPSTMGTKRSWQSLDAVLRSDSNSAAALPTRRLRRSRLFTALTVASGILTIAGTAASAREGLDLKELNGTGGLLLGAGIATVVFGITAGIMYGKSRAQYELAVDVYNDSLGMRLGLNTPAGAYIPPSGVLLDDEGFVMLADETPTGPAEAPTEPSPEPAAQPEVAPAAPASPEPVPVAPAEPVAADPVAAEPVAAEPAPAPEPVVPAPAEPAPPAAVVPAPGAASGGIASLSLSPRG